MKTPFPEKGYFFFVYQVKTQKMYLAKLMLVEKIAGPKGKKKRRLAKALDQDNKVKTNFSHLTKAAPSKAE